MVTESTPYSKFMNKKLVALEDAIILKNETNLYMDEYAMELKNYNTYNDLTLFENTIVPKGSIYTFSKAVEITNGTSGFTRAYLLGEVILAKTNQKHTIIYSCGLLTTFAKEDKKSNYWVYDKAPWQLKKDNKKYYVD